MNAAVVVPLTRTPTAVHRRTVFTAVHSCVFTTAHFHRRNATPTSPLSLSSKSSAHFHLSMKVFSLGGDDGGNANDEEARAMMEHFFSIGAVARSILKHCSGTEVLAYVSQVNSVALPKKFVDDGAVTWEQIESNTLRCPNLEYSKKMTAAIAVKECDSAGGMITCIVRNIPPITHAPEALMFQKLKDKLVDAVSSIPAEVKGFDFVTFPEDTFTSDSEYDEEIERSGAIQGGPTNGEVIKLKIAFGPTTTVSMGIMAQGHNYPCILPLVVPLVEAAVASQIAEHLMAQLFS